MVLAVHDWIVMVQEKLLAVDENHVLYTRYVSINIPYMSYRYPHA